MAVGQGFLSTAGIKAETAWGEAWAAVDKAIPFLTESIVSNYDRNVDNSLVGKAGVRSIVKGVNMVAGDIVTYLDYDLNHSIMLKAAMGGLAGGVYSLTNTLQASGNYFRAEFDKQVSRYRASGLKVNSMVLTSTAGADSYVNATFSCIGKSLVRVATAFPSISISAQRNVMHSDLTFRIADKADALAPGDAIGINQWTLTLNNNLQADAKDNTSAYILEPLRNGMREVTLALVVPRYTSDAFQDWKDADTVLQADLTFTDGVNTIKIEIPELKIQEGADANIGGAEMIPLNITMRALRNSSGVIMAGITDEFAITLT